MKRLYVFNHIIFLAFLGFCLMPASVLAQGFPPVGGGGTCTGMVNEEGFQAQQSAVNNALYVCSGGVWVEQPLIIGTTASTCNATWSGGIRYSSTQGCIELCDGTSWQCMFASACDNAPAFPVFADQTNLATSNLTLSNIVLVTGMDAACNASVGISGTGGSPEYRVCSDATCSSVDITWTASNNSVAMQGKYIQLRATSSASVATAFTITATIGTVASNWLMSTGMTGCTPIGTVCSDGTVYAGLSGASTPMYTTRCDAGQTWNGSACTGTSSTFCWNNCNTTGAVSAGVSGTADGQTNTSTLISADSDSVVGGIQQHIAAQYCADLSQDGHSDWYLPAKNELNTLYINKTAIGNFNTSGSNYWSSSETSAAGAATQKFSNGSQNLGNKYDDSLVRCTRR